MGEDQETQEREIEYMHNGWIVYLQKGNPRQGVRGHIWDLDRRLQRMRQQGVCGHMGKRGWIENFKSKKFALFGQYMAIAKEHLHRKEKSVQAITLLRF